MAGTKEPRTPSVVVLFHRPIEDPFHGASVTCSGLVEVLRRTVPVEVVSPPPDERDPVARGRSTAGMTTIRHLLRLVPRLLRSFLSDCAAGHPSRGRAILAFGAWVAGPAAFWARFRGYALIYYPQDFIPAVGQSWRASGKLEGELFHRLLWPVERRTLRHAKLVLVHSESMRDAYRGVGVDPSLLQVYSVPRKVPTLDPSAVEGWRARLQLGDSTAVVFVGTFEYSPNVRAFEFIRSKLAPVLVQMAPEVRLLVVGSGSEGHSRDLPTNMRALGAVEDLNGLLWACPVGIAPMDTPGGRSNKIFDYALHGMKVIATAEAAGGMPTSPNILLSNLDQFADTIRTVVRTVRQQGWSNLPRVPDPAYLDYNQRFGSVELGLRVRELLREPTA